MAKNFDDKARMKSLEDDVLRLEKLLDQAKKKRDAFANYLITVGETDEVDLPVTTVEDTFYPPLQKGEKLSLKEAIARVLVPGRRMKAAEVLDALEKGEIMPESSDPLSYVRSCLASNFKRVPGERGLYECPETQVVTPRKKPGPKPKAKKDPLESVGMAVPASAPVVSDLQGECISPLTQRKRDRDEYDF